MHVATWPEARLHSWSALPKFSVLSSDWGWLSSISTDVFSFNYNLIFFSASQDQVAGIPGASTAGA